MRVSCVLVFCMAVSTALYREPLADAVDSTAPLTGTFRLAGPLRFGDIEDGMSHFYFYLDGVAARTMYDALASEPSENECGVGLVKRTGPLECTRDDETYRCEFSVEQATARIGIASTC